MVCLFLHICAYFFLFFAYFDIFFQHFATYKTIQDIKLESPSLGVNILGGKNFKGSKNFWQ